MTDDRGDPQVLVIEDDEKFGALLCRGLARSHFAPSLATTGQDGLDAVRKDRFAVVILDLGLPDIPGIEVCRTLRARGEPAGILMLTAASSTAERVLGLNAGADDYLGKPFAFAELVARLQALIRRTQRQSDVVVIGDLEIDLRTVEVRRGGERIPLRPQEFRVLAVLATHANESVSRRTILDEAWDWALDPVSNLADVYIATLRTKIDRPFGRHSIRTVRGFGYALTPG